ncbi:hypothetical protein SAMN05216266_12478 [Amycolatopsis marina]|uniref:Uncharacterized protein n=1 Tax=Amycolatopsis marina TaxID=490629 RepID=A0A1I1CBT7_9PSEU|nr:hypothetical protein [Amycolatopsis marina]SFB59857.1 hypothetical protein SAMN05216266_12478 [Amycolatopsis marina]
MARATTPGTARGLRGTRAAGVLPLIAGVTSALALTGAAFYTVEYAGCGDSGQYIRHDSHIELVGSCVDGAKLPAVDPTQNQRGPADNAGTSNYRP